jgi:hypothetical protein
MLIDELREEEIKEYTEHDNFKWYIAKPPVYSYFSFPVLWHRLKNAFRVATGKSFAVHYKVDE